MPHRVVPEELPVAQKKTLQLLVCSTRSYITRTMLPAGFGTGAGGVGPITGSWSKTDAGTTGGVGWAVQVGDVAAMDEG